MPGTDLHTHLAPRLAADVPAAGVRLDTAGFIEAGGRRLGLPPLYFPELLDAHLRACDLDTALVSMPPPFFLQHLDRDAAETWVRDANEGMLEAVRDRPALAPLAYLPLEHPELAFAEYERVREDETWAGVVGSAGGESISLAAEALEPLWESLAGDDRLLLLHPGTSPDPRLHEFYLGNLLGNPVETAVAAAQLVFGEVLSRHPRVRVLLVHCGGCVPGLVGRWERGAESSRPGLPDLAESPRQAVRRFYVDCLAHDAGVLDLAVETFGEDKVVLGSDWPFPMGTSDPRDLVMHRGAAFAERVAVANARAALGRP